MSHRLRSTHCRGPSTSDNPYQATTTATVPQYQGSVPPKCRNNYYRNGIVKSTTIDTGLSDDTITESQSYYDYSYQGCRYDRSFSDDSGSSRIPDYYENESGRKYSRNTFLPDKSCGWKIRDRVNPLVHKDVKRIYPQHCGLGETDLYLEVSLETVNENVVPQNNLPRRLPNSRLSDRPQSSMSSGVTSAVVDGCGGKCQTFENVCYFFLQLVFMMGILIGVSLCIAGLVLRKSAARNLQVLVYIGILLTIVSSALLGIQWNARTLARKRKMAVRNTKRTPIPLEPLHSRNQPLQQPLMATLQEGQRVMQQTLPVQADRQGIPWWRRKDIT